ncbi:MAG: RidA family protein [Fusobacteriota bacterium]
MNKKINPDNFTKTVGAYSHGIKVPLGEKSMIFLTGQIAMDKNGDAVAPDDIKEQTVFIFKNIKRLLKEAGANLKDIVKIQIFLIDMDDFSKITPIRDKYLSEARPVSTLVEVSGLVKKGCHIEIEATAIIDN